MLIVARKIRGVAVATNPVNHYYLLRFNKIQFRQIPGSRLSIDNRKFSFNNRSHQTSNLCGIISEKLVRYKLLDKG